MEERKIAALETIAAAAEIWMASTSPDTYKYKHS
jgi:hypothetical protein